MDTCGCPGRLQRGQGTRHLIPPLHRNQNARKTHCPRGHPCDPGNTYLDPKGWRRCRACKLEKERKRRAAKQAPLIKAAKLSAPAVPGRLCGRGINPPLARVELSLAETFPASNTASGSIQRSSSQERSLAFWASNSPCVSTPESRSAASLSSCPTKSGAFGPAA